MHVVFVVTSFLITELLLVVVVANYIKIFFLSIAKVCNGFVKHKFNFSYVIVNVSDTLCISKHHTK